MRAAASEQAAETPDAREGSDVEAAASLNEMLRIIDGHLPVELRSTYLQMLAGRPVPANHRRRVEEAVRDILGEKGEGPPQGAALYRNAERSTSGQSENCTLNELVPRLDAKPRWCRGPVDQLLNIGA